MGPIWGQEDPGGPHVGPMNFAIWDEEIGAVFFFQEAILLTWIIFNPSMDK